MFFDLKLAWFHEMLKNLATEDHWPFLHGHRSPPRVKNLAGYEQECAQIAEEFFNTPPNIRSRAFGRHRYVLHAFSGRRRIGDFQFFFDKITARHTGFVIHVISMDIVNDAILGDAMNEQTCTFWCEAVRRQFVIAFLGGPPCESWSYARGKQLSRDSAQQRHGPRVIRDATRL